MHNGVMTGFSRVQNTTKLSEELPKLSDIKNRYICYPIRLERPAVAALI
jgi:hypothetical protein